MIKYCIKEIFLIINHIAFKELYLSQLIENGLTVKSTEANKKYFKFKSIFI